MRTFPNLLSAVLAAVLVCMLSTLQAEDTPASSDWPMYIESGDRTPPVKGIELVDDLNAIRQAWKFKRHMGVGKGLYPGTLKRLDKMGIEPFQGGAASPVIADGVVFVSYYKPDGKHPAAREGWRTMDSAENLMLLPDWFYSVTADDILVALDADTGKLLWERVEKGKGLNRLSHKRSHWSVSPACADGTVFHMGSMGILYATRIKDGKELWETRTDPGLEKTRQEHIKNKKLCWDSADRSSLIVAEDVVIVSRGQLQAYGKKDGELKWQTKESVQGKYSTPTLWRHNGRTYVLTNAGGGTLRLIDPRNGKILWSHSELGPFLGTLSVTGDQVILNKGSKKSQDKKNDGLYAMYRLSLNGPQELWSLPDEPMYWHSWTPDEGPRQKACIQGDLAYMPLRHGNPPKGSPRLGLIVADSRSGKIHSVTATPANRNSAKPLLLEDRILLVHDDAHGDPVTVSWWTNGKQPRRLTPCTALPHVAITAYCTPIVLAYSDGRIYCRAMDGLVCYDLRKPKKGTANSLHLIIPGELAGPRGDLKISLYTDKGDIDRGGVEGGGFIHNVDVSKLTWDGNHLTGSMGIDLPRTRKAEYYHVDAKVFDDGRLEGTVTLTEPGLKQPEARKGVVKTMKHQPAWQPACDYVLWLEEAAMNREGHGGRLLLFVTTRDGEVTRLQAWADQTTKTRPVLYPQSLELKDGRLKGTIDVRYRADEWTHPLTDSGNTAAATYTFDAKLEKSDGKKVGNYTGTYGVKWSKTVKLTGRLVE